MSNDSLISASEDVKIRSLPEGQLVTSLRGHHDLNHLVVSLDRTMVAIAAVHEIDFLMTWNCVHIANAVIAREVAKICRRCGFQCPAIFTPEELLGQ